MMASISTARVADAYLSGNFISDVDVSSIVEPSKDFLVTSDGIWNAMATLSNDLTAKLQPQVKTDAKLFDFTEIPTIPVSGVDDARKVVVEDANGDYVLSTVHGYGEGSHYFRIPSIVSLNNGRKIAIFDVRWNSTKDIGTTICNDQCIGQSHSDNYGKSWSQPQCIIDWTYPNYDEQRPLDEYQSGASDPGMIYDEEHNVVMVFALAGYGNSGRQCSIISVGQPYSELSSYQHQQMAFTYSIDNGNTWASPTSVTSRIFDVNGTTQEWANAYRLCFPACTSGIQLKRQSNASNNGKLVFPVQLIKQQGTTPAWQSTLRTAFLEVQPTYNEDNNVVDIKLVFIPNSSGNLALLGEDIGGSNECSICEGPNGELVAALRSYHWISNPDGLYSSSAVSVKVVKASAFGEDWEVIGDYADGEDKICTSLQTSGGTKPAIAWSSKIGMYLIGYVQALHGIGDDRRNLILRSSKDLVDWRYFNTLELKEGLGYITCVPQQDELRLLECIYEAYNDGIEPGQTKQLKYASFKLDGTSKSLFSSSYLDQANIAHTGQAIQGFSFNLSQAYQPGLISPFSSVARPFSKMKVFWGAFGQSSIYCVLYDGNSNDAMPLACSNVLDLSTAEAFPNFFVDFTFNKEVFIYPGDNHEYFVMFKSGAVPSDVMSTPRGALPTSYGNFASVTTFNSQFNSTDFMKVYRNGSVLVEAGHPLAVMFDLHN